MPYIIGIGGGTGAGKSHLAQTLATRYSDLGVCVLDEDSYYKDQSGTLLEKRGDLNFDLPSAIDRDLLYYHIKSLKRGDVINKPIYCFITHTRTSQSQTVKPVPIIIIEGLFVFSDSRIRSLLDLKVFIDVEADLRLIRRVRRDLSERGRSLDSILAQYLSTTRPMHRLYIEPAKAYADILLGDAFETSEIFGILDGELPFKAPRLDDGPGRKEHDEK